MKLMKKAAVNVATLQAIASGAATGAPLHLKSVSAHFMFGPRLLHTSNIISKKCAPLWFLVPLLRNPGDGPATLSIKMY